MWEDYKPHIALYVWHLYVQINLYETYGWQRVLQKNGWVSNEPLSLLTMCYEMVVGMIRKV